MGPIAAIPAPVAIELEVEGTPLPSASEAGLAATELSTGSGVFEAPIEATDWARAAAGGPMSAGGWT